MNPINYHNTITRWIASATSTIELDICQHAISDLYEQNFVHANAPTEHVRMHVLLLDYLDQKRIQISSPSNDETDIYNLDVPGKD